ncbi:MAG TPA: hypothetical protein VFA72_11570 [Burkholderiales bacterium]|jgi:hypothetical protein|nr:hypothetical protein [Burkholderiales bacterium]
MDHVALRRRVEANLRIAGQTVLQAQRLVHDARNLRQRVLGRRYLKKLRESQPADRSA